MIRNFDKPKNLVNDFWIAKKTTNNNVYSKLLDKKHDEIV